MAMEESKLDKYKSGAKRLFSRTNERLKQKMGRSSDPIVSKDDKWQVLVANFNRQQTAAFKLHREVKGYIASLKTMENSTQTLLDAVREMHEYTWPGNMSLVKALQGLDKLNKELNEVMVDCLLVPVNNYVEIFPQIRERMSKRERKLLDYTRSKRNLDTLKKGDKISPDKLGLAQEEYSQNKMIYEEVNSDLCEDLPELWNSRKTYILKFLDTYFKQSTDFHKEFTQVYSECSLSLEPLKEQVKTELPPQRGIGNVDKFFLVSDNARRFKRQSLRKSMRKSGSSFKRSLSMGAIKKKKVDNKETPQSMSSLSVDPYTLPAQQANFYSPTKSTPVKKSSPQRPKPPRALDNIDNATATVTADPAAPFSPSIKVDPGMKVECIHVYKAVDEDELSFAAGDVVTVVQWDSTDEQDEGWFMGVLDGTGAKGAFPINYTRRFNDAIVEEDEEVFSLNGPSSLGFENIPGSVEVETVASTNLDHDDSLSGSPKPVEAIRTSDIRVDPDADITADTGTADIDTADVDITADIDTADIDTADIDTADIDAADTGPADIDIGATDIGTVDIDTPYADTAGIGTADTDTADTGTADIDTADTGTTDIDIAGTGTTDNGTAELGGSNIDAVDVDNAANDDAADIDVKSD